MNRIHQLLLFLLNSITRVGSQTWTVDQILKPSDGEPVDNFGRSLAIEKDSIAVGAPLGDVNGDDTIVAGARFDDVNGAYGNGEAYVFTKNPTTGNWTETQRLSVPLPQTNAHFGDGMAIDDRTLVIGEPGTNNYEGAVHVFIRPNKEWVLQTVLYPPKVFGAQEEFGTSVDVHGDWVVAGAKQTEEGEELPGYAMIFYRDQEGVWDGGFLIQPDESSNDDEFGRSVTIQGDTVVVARESDSFVFKRTGTADNPNEWTQMQKIDSGKAVQLGGDGLLVTSDSVYSQDENGNFVPMDQEKLDAGSAFSRVYNVAISGNIVLIGEPNFDRTGVVTVLSTTTLADATLAPVSAPFSLSPTPMPVSSLPTALATNRPTQFLQQIAQWLPFQELTASDGMSDDLFGYGVAIDGNTLVAGAHFHIVNETKSGAAYVFELVNGAWVETQKLVSDDPDDSDYFAQDVAIKGNQIALGARFDDNGRGDFGSGRVYMFLKDESTGNWSQTQMLEDVYGETNGNYGEAVAMNDNFLLVGEPGVRQAHVYRSLGNGNWELSMTFLPDRPALEEFGVAVGISGSTAVVGAPSELPHNRPGFVTIYKFTEDGGWSSGFKLPSSEPSERDEFGSSVAIDGITLVVGARQSTFIFEQSDSNDETSWRQIQKIREKGTTIALDGDYLMIGRTMYTKLSDGVWRLQQNGELLPSEGSDYVYNVDVSGSFAVLGHPFSNDSTGLLSIYQNRFFVPPTESPSVAPSDQPSLVPSSAPTLVQSSSPTVGPTKTPAAPNPDRGLPSSAASLRILWSYCVVLFILPMSL